MPDVLETLKKLPPTCAATVNGETVLITRGVVGHETAPFGVDSVEDYNHQRGITAAQRQAMEMGSTMGWHVEGADPDHWMETLEGEVTIPKFYRYMAPLQLVISVTEYNEPLAAQSAEQFRQQFINRAKGLLSVIGPELVDVITDGELDLIEDIAIRE